jgi:hypothetical protein
VVDRLDQVCVEARFSRSIPIFFLPPARQRDQDQIPSPRLFPDSSTRFVAVHSGQADVEQHDIGMESLGGFDRFESIVCLVGLVTAELQQHGERVRAVQAVVDDQDAQGPCLRRLATAGGESGFGTSNS